MIGLEDRQALARDIHIAQGAGARLRLACETAGIALRTLQRWKAVDGLVSGDGRPLAVRATPSHALSEAERAQVLAVVNEARFAEVPPARIVPMLADEGVYVASESSFSRVLKAHGQTAHRGRAKAPKQRRPPTTHIATAPRQVWCWDMTYLPAQVLGRWFHLYLILDLYSRKIVGWEVHDSDHADHAAHLVRRTALAEGIAALANKPVLHGDNGSTLKATTVASRACARPLPLLAKVWRRSVVVGNSWGGGDRSRTLRIPPSGHDRSVDCYLKPPPERPLRSGTRRMANSHNSAPRPLA